MNTQFLIEAFGYLGSTLVVVSMLMSSVKKLRLVNTVGSTIFATYALIIHSYPTAIMNVCLVLINLYNIRKLSQPERHFELTEAKMGESLLQSFFNYYKTDITSYFPEWERKMDEANLVYMVSNDAVPAGVMFGKREGEQLTIYLDYSTPTYRDCAVSDYLYKNLAKIGIKTCIFAEKSKGHEEYMLKVGFKKVGDQFVREL